MSMIISFFCKKHKTIQLMRLKGLVKKGPVIKEIGIK